MGDRIMETDLWRLRMASLTPRERVGAMYAAQAAADEAESDRTLALMGCNLRAAHAAHQERERWLRQVACHRRLLAGEVLAA